MKNLLDLKIYFLSHHFREPSTNKINIICFSEFLPALKCFASLLHQKLSVWEISILSARQTGGERNVIRAVYLAQYNCDLTSAGRYLLSPQVDLTDAHSLPDAYQQIPPY